MEQSPQLRRNSDQQAKVPRWLAESEAQWLKASWEEQRLQFILRYIVVTLTLCYFNFFFTYISPWLSLSTLNFLLVIYYLWNSTMLWHAYHVPRHVLRFRLAMWMDLLFVTVAVANDPFVVPLTMLIYVMIVLGNGMRYGLHSFAEAIVGSFVGGMVGLSLRYNSSMSEMGAGVLFLNIFGGITALYAYILMRKLDGSRRRLELTSRLDPLTGLLNRAALFMDARQILEQVAQGQASVALLFVDLDRFKQVNDNHGHAAGDQVLVALANILRKVTRRGDLAARYGGDEFIVVLRETAMEQAERVKQRIQEAFAEWMATRHYDVTLTIGVSLSPEQGTTLETLLHHADEQLYKHKQSRAD